MGNTDETRRAFEESLSAEAVRRFGTGHLAALRETIAQTAGHLADVALFPVGAEERPTFEPRFRRGVKS